MGRLDDIPKHDFFKVPEGYFQKLPTRIQSRLASPERRSTPVLRYALTYVLPLFLVAVVVLWLSRPSVPGAETLLSEVETTDLIQYLQENEVTTEEIIEQIDLSDEELEALENQVYQWDISDPEEHLIESP